MLRSSNHVLSIIRSTNCGTNSPLPLRLAFCSVICFWLQFIIQQKWRITMLRALVGADKVTWTVFGHGAVIKPSCHELSSAEIFPGLPILVFLVAFVSACSLHPCEDRSGIGWMFLGTTMSSCVFTMEKLERKNFDPFCTVYR